MSKREWQDEFNMAKLLLRASDTELKWSSANYEAFKFKKGDVSLLFYPHRAASMNYHIRVRDQGSKNKPFAKRIMDLLSVSTGCCTFSQKNRPSIARLSSKWAGTMKFMQYSSLMDDAAILEVEE